MLAPCLAMYEQISLPVTGLCTVTFFPVTFFPTCPLFLFPCYFFSTATLIESTELLLVFLIPVFLLGHCCFLSCYFFSYLPTVSFFPSLYLYCYPNELLPFFLFLFFPHLCPLLLSFLLPFFLPETVTFFPVSFFPTCPLLLSFLLLFFLLLFFLPETVTFFPVTFFPVTFFPCTHQNILAKKCWLRSLLPYGVTMHQWVNLKFVGTWAPTNKIIGDIPNFTAQNVPIFQPQLNS